MDLLVPMLADPLPKSKLEKLLTNDNWRGECKVDGDRLLIHVDNGTVIPVNRKGEVTSLPSKAIANSFATLTTSTWAFDGEAVGHEFYVWDMPIAGTAVSPSTPFETRRTVLESFMEGWKMDETIHLITSFREEDEKRALLQRVIDHGGEGIMLKDVTAPYYSGKRTDRVKKYKLWAACDVIVLEVGVDGKSNAVMGLIDPDRGVVGVGTVSTLGRWSTMVTPGQCLEIKYLYSVAGTSPKLVQPSILKIRDDKTIDECTFDQLKFTNKNVIEVV